MSRTTVDIILLGLYEDPDQQLKPSKILSDSGYSVDSVELRRVIIELINEGLIEEGELWGNEHYVRLTGKGVSLLNQHKSYDKYLETQRTTQQKFERKERSSRNWTMVFGITTAIFGLFAVALGVLSYLDKQELNEKMNQIKEQETTIKTQQTKLDSFVRVKPDTLKE